MKKKLVLGALGAVAASAAIFRACAVTPTVVYGPPPEEPSPAKPSETPFQAEENLPVVVYGPPNMFDEPVFSPEDNIPVDLYGPPAFFDEEEEPQESEDDEIPESGELPDHENG